LELKYTPVFGTADQHALPAARLQHSAELITMLCMSTLPRRQRAAGASSPTDPTIVNMSTMPCQMNSSALAIHSSVFQKLW
jgi:hypothetical protein